MNRKLHNTLMAVIASSSLLTLGLVAGKPVMPSLQALETPSATASLQEAAMPGASIEEGTPATPRRAIRRAVRGNRQSVSMPFFSFVPRG